MDVKDFYYDLATGADRTGPVRGPFQFAADGIG